MLPSSLEQDLDLDAPVEPFKQATWLDGFRSSPEVYEGGGFTDHMPLWYHPEVRYVLGFRGTNFLKGKIQQQYFWNKKEQCLEGAVYFSKEVEGPPGRVHGGCIAATFDTIMGFFCTRFVGSGYYTLNLNTNYAKFIPLQSVVRFKCSAIETAQDKRKIKSVCQFFDGETNELLAEANSLFYHPPKDGPSIPYDVMQKGMQGLSPEQFVEYVKKKRTTKSPNAAPWQSGSTSQAKL